MCQNLSKPADPELHFKSTVFIAPLEVAVKFFVEPNHNVVSSNLNKRFIEW